MRAPHIACRTPPIDPVKRRGVNGTGRTQREAFQYPTRPRMDRGRGWLVLSGETQLGRPLLWERRGGITLLFGNVIWLVTYMYRWAPGMGRWTPRRGSWTF